MKLAQRILWSHGVIEEILQVVVRRVGERPGRERGVSLDMK